MDEATQQHLDRLFKSWFKQGVIFSPIHRQYPILVTTSLWLKVMLFPTVQTMPRITGEIPQNYHEFASTLIPPNGWHLMTREKERGSKNVKLSHVLEFGQIWFSMFFSVWVADSFSQCLKKMFQMMFVGSVIFMFYEYWIISEVIHLSWNMIWDFAKWWICGKCPPSMNSMTCCHLKPPLRDLKKDISPQTPWRSWNIGTSENTKRPEGCRELHRSVPRRREHHPGHK